MSTAREKRPPARTTCPRCDAAWTGLATCHCGSCHRTFTGVNAFDAHRAGQHASGHRHCVDPATLVFGSRNKAAGQPMFRDAGRAYPCWASNREDDRWSEE